MKPAGPVYRNSYYSALPEKKTVVEDKLSYGYDQTVYKKTTPTYSKPAYGVPQDLRKNIYTAKTKSDYIDYESPKRRSVYSKYEEPEIEPKEHCSISKLYKPVVKPVVVKEEEHCDGKKTEKSVGKSSTDSIVDVTAISDLVSSKASSIIDQNISALNKSHRGWLVQDKTESVVDKKPVTPDVIEIHVVPDHWKNTNRGWLTEPIFADNTLETSVEPLTSLETIDDLGSILETDNEPELDILGGWADESEPEIDILGGWSDSDIHSDSDWPGIGSTDWSHFGGPSNNSLGGYGLDSGLGGLSGGFNFGNDSLYDW